MLVAIARPAASSFEELMRWPVDRRSIAVAVICDALVAAFEARRAPILVLITVMFFPL